MRISSFLWVQDCHSSDADGNVVERRYPGEESLVLLTGRVYYGGGFGVEETQVRLIPRSLFFQSELYHRLNQTDGLTAGPILENAKVVWRDLARENEDALLAVINVGGSSTRASVGTRPPLNLSARPLSATR